MTYMKKAVIFYGPPGAGKGTQAELIAKLGYFVHFDTGRYIENILRNSDIKKNSILRREKKLFDSGKLCTPSWVLETIKKEANNICKANLSVVFSGSPRTLFEAFGEKNQKGLLFALSQFYGKKNILIIQLLVSHKGSLKRNSGRFVCSLCGLPRLAHAKNKMCSFCDAPLRKRTLDNPKVITTRLEEYEKRTYPIILRAKNEGYQVKKINGEKLPFEVFKTVRKIVNI